MTHFISFLYEELAERSKKNRLENITYAAFLKCLEKASNKYSGWKFLDDAVRDWDDDKFDT